MKNIGIKVKKPQKECKDVHCPFHSGLKVKGRIFRGIVRKDSANKTVQVEFPYLFMLPKYERYEKRRSRIQAHNPPCLDVKVGDKVKIMECRPISKTKNFVVIEHESG